MLPLNPDATATVLITGLALCRQMDDRWEVLFLHPKGTTHKLDVKLIVRRASTAKPEVTDLLTDVTGVESLISGTGVKPPATLSYKNHNWTDNEDLCWVMDLDELNGEPIQLMENPDVAHSFLTIHGSVFYTAGITPELYSITRDGQEIEVREIGKVIGGDIECDPGGAVRLELNGNQIDLPQEDGARYEIVFNNDCNPCDPGGDFHHYYEIIENPNGQIDLSKLGKPLTKKKNDEAACNPPTGGGGSRRSFKELFDSSK